jgi:hypothetical protein
MRSGQSKWMSLVEASGNTATGFFISLAVQDVGVNWYYNLPITFSDSLAITCVFTVVSVVRSYVWRRYMNRRDL